MKVALLHLSDIHFDDSKSNPVISKADAIASTSFKHLVDVKAVFIVVSGDIAQSGTANQYAIAEKFLRRIEEVIKSEVSVALDFVIVPGNHDCDFSLEANTRKGSVLLIEADGVNAVDDSVIDSCTAVQEHYFSFRDTFDNGAWLGDKLFRSQKFALDEDYSLNFETLNISWVSKLRESPGKLYFPFQRYSETPVASEVNVLVMHHPLNWFSQSIYRDFRKFVRSRATILVTGHEHQAGISEIDELESGKSIALEGCVLQHEKGLTQTGFNVVLLDLLAKQYQVTHYITDGGSYSSQGMGSWSDYRPLPEKRDSLFRITEGFQSLIDDPGAYMAAHAAGDLRLADIYVYPDLRPLGSSDDKRRYVSASTLLSPDALGDGVLIQGEDRAGATSLLYQLYREYHDRGYVPLYIKGNEIRRQSPDEIDGVVRRAVIHQYGEQAVVPFGSMAKQNKIVLLDDFDECPMRADSARASALKNIKARFGHIAVAVGPMFEMKEIVSDGVLDAEIQGFERFQLQPFGNMKRAELVRRWFEAHDDLSIDEGEFLGRCDAAERLINGVMDKSLIPHIPLHMLTLLQSMDTGRSGELKDSALGHYYQFLLTAALQREGVKADRLNHHYQYCAHLAWEFHRLGGGPISLTQLKSFNSRYSEKWYTVELGHELSLLERARVLSRTDEYYTFRYPYIYYFLKGFYINQNIDENGMREYVAECCDHLYVRDHANTILFLAHHATGDFVVAQIESSLKNVFSDRCAITFGDDTKPVTLLIANAPELSYGGGAPEHHRNRKHRLEDEMDDGKDGLLDRPESGIELSLAAKLATLSKTSEILGQVLKDQYAKIPRARKLELIEGIYEGALRAMADFFVFMTSHSEKVLTGLRAKLDEEGRTSRTEENEKAARVWVATLVQAVTVGLIMRAAQNTGSEDLREDVAKVVENNDEQSYRMIELATYLDSARALPRAMIERAYLESENNIVVRQVLMLMILNRLYMFKTAEGDMKWLAAKVGLRMDVQKSLAYHRDEIKRLQ